ncbi:MAG TPA: glutamate-1-semialdehyde 2,1-aminomutase [Fibrobacteria bacterium]|nr:glutamate-1-semialdehyde 2,1-aminomutase [Fibrobacteria bacterium]
MDSRDWFERARAVIPGGVHSPVRAFGNVGCDPFYVASAKGARLTTVDGRDLVDWVGSWGPMILGHNPSCVVEAIQGALARGTSYGACSVPEVELSEAIRERMPWMERVRLVSSGTEATMSALRLARGATGRAAFIKFRGCYHGHGDSFLVAAGSGALTHGHPSSPGVTDSTAADTLIAEFNDLDSVRAAFDARKGDVACLFVEPVPGNMGVIPPEPGFPEGLRELCTREGALLVFDEVMTGFRLGPSGAAGRFGILPDLVTLGKIIGGGLPLAAFGGRADLMEKLSPLGPVYQAGTLSGNPLACAAGLALLRALDDSSYQALEAKGRRLEERLAPGLRGKPVVFQRVGSMATLFCHFSAVRTYADVMACDKDAFGRLFRFLLDKGHFLPPAQFEAFFLSMAHSEGDLDALADAIVEGIGAIFPES